MSVETKWTKEQWRVQDEDYSAGENLGVGVGEVEICQVLGSENFPCLDEGQLENFDAEVQANAQLIAAAPELYAALDEAVQGCGCSLRERESGHRVDCYVPLALDAMAKARGEGNRPAPAAGG